MNDLQIKYFLTAAQKLNFTEAAKELFISQPALSQQITAIEKELNMQLFIRDKNKLRLTPAATVLMQEFPECNQRYRMALERARIVNEGHSGLLRLGILEGQILPPNFRAAFDSFRTRYPSIHIEMHSDSFHTLRKKLDSQELDVALTISFDIKNSASYLSIETDSNDCALLAADFLPITRRKIKGWSDLANETIILVGAEDSASVKALVEEDCRQAGFVPRLLFASSLSEQMLWIDAGLGVGVSNSGTYVATNPRVKCLKRFVLGGEHFVIAWHRSNINSAIPLFTNFVADYIAENDLLK